MPELMCGGCAFSPRWARAIMPEVLRPAGDATVAEARTWKCDVIERQVQPDRSACQQFEART